MMFINLISGNAYNSYNIQLANILGLHEAIYLNEIINLQQAYYTKNNIVTGFIPVDRDYIKSRTTLSFDEQKSLQAYLELLKILVTQETNKENVFVDNNRLISLISEGDKDYLLKNVTKEIKTKKRQTKAEVIRQRLKQNIDTNNEELRNAYCEWIDSVSMKNGYMAKKAVIQGQKVVDEFCNRDLDKALKVIEIATVHSYVDMNWAINIFKKDYSKTFNKNTNIIQNVNQLSTEVF